MGIDHFLFKQTFQPTYKTRKIKLQEPKDKVSKNLGLTFTQFW